VNRAFRIAVAWLLLSEACYAVMRVTTRMSAAVSDLSWAEVAAFRFLVGALVPVVIARLRGTSLRVRDGRNAWLRSLFGMGGALALFHALGTHALSVGDATTLYATAPLWVAILSGPILGEQVGRSVAVAVVVGFVGVATLLHDGFDRVGPTGLLVLLGACSFALAILRVRRLSAHESSEAIGLHMSLSAGVVMLAIALPTLRPIPTVAWAPLLASALSGGLGQAVFARAYEHSKASTLAAFNYAGVLFTYLLELALFHRVPEAHQWLGALLVVGAGVFVSIAAVRRAPTPQASASR
jgi:drug/metabolite transporter (DMT)-like permease